MRRPGPGQGNHGIASTFGSLRGMSRVEAEVFLRSLGAEVRTTAGGYTRYTFSDSSEVWLHPNGEIIRTQLLPILCHNLLDKQSWGI